MSLEPRSVRLAANGIALAYNNFGDAAARALSVHSARLTQEVGGFLADVKAA